MTDVVRGRLGGSASAPAQGENVEQLVTNEVVVVEHILSGRLGSPVDYVQDHDEWVIVLEGSASLEVSGETVSLSTGDWLLVPEGTPHRLVRTEPGTRWLAVRFNAR